MVKYCVFGDIHGNYPALKSVVNNTDVDKYICTGDILGLMGFPHKTTVLIKSLSDINVIGNHDFSILYKEQGLVGDSELSHFEYGISKKLLTENDVKWLLSKDSYVKESPFIVTHAQPFPEKSSGLESQKQYKKKDYITLASKLSNTEDIDFILKGHTHQQSYLNCEKFGYDFTIVNPGSVGQISTYADSSSSDINEADYSIIDTDDNTVENHTVEYNFTEVLDRFDKLNAPDKIYKLMDI